jgi:hypothetical protein
MTDLVGNFSALFDNLPDMGGDAIAAATGIDKNTLMMGAGTLLAVGAGAALLFRHRRHTQATPKVIPSAASLLASEPAATPAPELPVPTATKQASAASSSSSHSQDDEPAEQEQYGSDAEVVYHSDDEISRRSERLKTRNKK